MTPKTFDRLVAETKTASWFFAFNVIVFGDKLPIHWYGRVFELLAFALGWIALAEIVQLFKKK